MKVPSNYKTCFNYYKLRHPQIANRIIHIEVCKMLHMDNSNMQYKSFCEDTTNDE